MRPVGGHITYMPGITGLRGVAVAAVVAYHLGYLRGGFLGVDVFFVLSGFLITTLLLEATPDGPRGLATWWTRRFTRLTPAVAVVVLAVLVAFLTTSGIVVDAIATLTWWQNWHLVAEGTPYWAGSPSPLRHAWSLSIEEQFYLVWPPALLAMLALARRARVAHPTRVVIAVALALSLASFAWAATLALGGDTSLSRIYFGTDTRAGALLIGCALAAVRVHRADRRGAPSRPSSTIENMAALVAFLGLGLLTLVLSPEQRWTYTGGLALAAVAALVMVNAASRTGPLASLLDRQPLQWLGAHSYAIYLWSWPIQVALETRAPQWSRWAVAVTTVGATLALSAVSLRLVEDPLRRASGWARRLRPRRVAWYGGAAVIALMMVVAANSTEQTVMEEVAEEFERLPDPTTTTTTTATTLVPATTTTCPPPPPVEVPQFQGVIDSFDYSTVTELGDPLVAECGAPPVRVLVVGDSTGRGAANAMRRQNATDVLAWDRTELACGLRAPTPECRPWRELWTEAVAEVDPDVVLAYVRPFDDLVPGADPEFLSEEGGALRRSEMSDATEILRAGGARVIWALPAAPLRIGSFYCDGRTRDSWCDPAWVTRWREDLTGVVLERGVAALDVQAWVDERSSTIDADRPDGLHFSGPALDAHGAWIVEQIRAFVG